MKNKPFTRLLSKFAFCLVRKEKKNNKMFFVEKDEGIL